MTVTEPDGAITQVALIVGVAPTLSHALDFKVVFCHSFPAYSTRALFNVSAAVLLLLFKG